MKNRIIVSVLFILVFSFPSMIAQDYFSLMSDFSTAEEKKELEKARAYYKKGDLKNKDIAAQDKKIDKYFRKGKKKAERKAVKVKEYRISQMKIYDKAYTDAFAVYQRILDRCDFIYQADANVANEIRDDASMIQKGANEKLVPYKNRKSKELKGIKYTTLKNDLNAVKSEGEQAIMRLNDTYDLYVAQDAKKDTEAAEVALWTRTKNKNTVAAYDDYMAEYPKGKYVALARAKKQSLIDDVARKAQAAAADAARNSQNNSNPRVGLVYFVQIKASVTKIPLANLAKIHTPTSEIVEQKDGKWYKYLIVVDQKGHRKYTEAKALSDKLNDKFVPGWRNTEANKQEMFVVGFMNGKRLKKIAEAIQIEGNQGN